MRTVPVRFSLLTVAEIYPPTPLEDGYGGAFSMGVSPGLSCPAPRWSVMVDMFIMGTMHLVRMGALGRAVLLEKSPPFGPVSGRGTGAALIPLGIALSMGRRV